MAETMQNASSFTTASAKFRKPLASNPVLRAKIIYLRNTSQQNHVNRMKKALALKQEQLENENSSISSPKKAEILKNRKTSAQNKTFEEKTTDFNASEIKNYENTLNIECVSFTSTNKCVKSKNQRFLQIANIKEKEAEKGDVFEKAEPIKSGVFATTAGNDNKYKNQVTECTSTMNDRVIKADGVLPSKLSRMKNKIWTTQNESEQSEFKLDKSVSNIKKMTGFVNSSNKANNEEIRESRPLLKFNFNDSSQSKTIHSLSTDSLESCTYRSPGIKVFNINTQSAPGNDFDKGGNAYTSSQVEEIYKKQSNTSSPEKPKAIKKEKTNKDFSRLPVGVKNVSKNSKPYQIAKPSKHYEPEAKEPANCRENTKQMVLNCYTQETKQVDNLKKKISTEEDASECMKKTTKEMKLSEVNLTHASLSSLASADKNSAVNIWLNNLSDAPADPFSEEEVNAETKKESSDPESNASIASNEVFWSLADLTHDLDKEASTQKGTLSTEIFSDCVAQKVTLPKNEKCAKGIVSKDGVSEIRTRNLISLRECHKSDDVPVARYDFARENTDSAETLRKDNPLSLKMDKTLNVSQTIKRKGVKIKKLRKVKKPTVKKKSIYSN